MDTDGRWWPLPRIMKAAEKTLPRKVTLGVFAHGLITICAQTYDGFDCRRFFDGRVRTGEYLNSTVCPFDDFDENRRGLIIRRSPHVKDTAPCLPQMFQPVAELW